MLFAFILYKEMFAEILCISGLRFLQSELKLFHASRGISPPVSNARDFSEFEFIYVYGKDTYTGFKNVFSMLRFINFMEM